MKNSMRSELLRYGLAVVLFGILLGISALLQYYTIRINLTILIVVGLVAASWYGGRGPGILVAVLVELVTIYSSPPAEGRSIPAYLFGHFSVFALLIFIVLLISGRKSAEKTLRDHGDLFSITLSSIGDAVIATDGDGRITFLNPTAETLTSLTAEEARGKSLNEVYNVIDEKSREPILGIFETIKEKREIVVFPQNTTLLSKGGREIPISDSGAPILDSRGVFMGAVIVFQDVTERRMSERALHESEGRLLQSQKMEAIGTLTGGIAHDFNNLLTAILGYTELSMLKLDVGSPVRENLVEVQKAGNRCTELTKKLLAFSRRQQLERRVIDLNESITGILKLLERIIGADVKVSFTSDPDLKAVFADPAQIEQVVMNLSLNARDAMPTGGKLAIETRNVELDEFYCRQYPTCVPGKYAQILVSDNGCGMNAETVERIFEPFFTTKDINKGTGLGLSMVYGIVKQHGGHINVYSEPGGGTTFKIFLPAVDIAVDIARHDVPLSFPGGTETILIAEDEEALRNLSKEVLENLGYTVITARNGEEAIALLTEQNNAVDLLLFDIVMPVMGGSEAYQRIKEMDGPEIPLIFMTGYSSEVLDSPYVKRTGSADFDSVRIIQKPYTLETLGRVVREVLDGTHSPT